MAGFIPANKTIRCTQLFLDSDGRVAQCRFFLQYSGVAPTGADLTALAGQLNSNLNTDLMPFVHNTWTSDLSTCTDLTSTTSATGETSSPAGGSLTGARLPGSTAMVVANTIGRRYRGGHSRVYLPVGDAAQLLSDNEWTTAFVSSVVTAWGDVIASLPAAIWPGGGAFTQVAPSFYDGYTWLPYGTPLKYKRVPTPRATALLDPVVTQVGRQVLGTQRRRLRTVG